MVLLELPGLLCERSRPFGRHSRRLRDLLDQQPAAAAPRRAGNVRDAASAAAAGRRAPQPPHAARAPPVQLCRVRGAAAAALHPGTLTVSCRVSYTLCMLQTPDDMTVSQHRKAQSVDLTVVSLLLLLTVSHG